MQCGCKNLSNRSSILSPFSHRGQRSLPGRNRVPYHGIWISSTALSFYGSYPSLFGCMLPQLQSWEKGTTISSLNERSKTFSFHSSFSLHCHIDLSPFPYSCQGRQPFTCMMKPQGFHVHVGTSWYHRSASGEENPFSTARQPVRCSWPHRPLNKGSREW